MDAPHPRAGIEMIRAHMQQLPDLGARPAIKLASNESAFGPSPHAIAAARAAAGHMERYAEQGTGALQAAIGGCFHLNAEQIVCGPGSDELLTRIMRAYLEPGQELIYSLHGYAKFANYAWASGARPVAAPDREFRADVEQILALVTDRTRIVALASPDNPTGTYVTDAEARSLREQLPERVILVYDAAYAEYVDAADYRDPASLVDDYANVIMTRTFSKIFGLAGERLGWLYAAPAVAEVMRRLGATFPVSATAMAAGIAAVQDTAHREFVKGESNALRESFSGGLRAEGLRVYPSQSNFVLADFGNPERAEGAYDYLLQNGIIARRLGPAFADCVRISVGMREQMTLCLEHLKTYVRAN